MYSRLCEEKSVNRIWREPYEVIAIALIRAQEFLDRTSAIRDEKRYNISVFDKIIGYTAIKTSYFRSAIWSMTRKYTLN